MGWEALVTIAVVALIFAALIRNVAPPDVVFVAGCAVLMTFSAFTKRLPSPAAIAQSFGNEGLLTVGVLYVVAAGLTETGALGILTERVLGRPRSERESQVRLLVPVMASSAFMNNTPLVAMFVPVVRDWCKKFNLAPSKLFMPLSYAAILGGLCTLIGTSANLVAKGFADDLRPLDPSMPQIGMWTLTPVGVPVAIIGLAFLLLFSLKLLPDRIVDAVATTDPREYTIEMLVAEGSPIVGKSIEDAGLRNLPGVFLTEIQRGDETLAAVGPEQVLRAHDRLIFVGVVEAVVDLQKVRGLLPATDQVFKLKDPRRARCLMEAVVSKTSPVAGRTVREARFRTRYDAAVLAVHRNGHRIRGKVGDIELVPGDILLLEGHRRFLNAYRNSQEFLLVSEIEGSTPLRHDKAATAILIVLGLVAAMAAESLFHVSIFAVAVIAAGCMVLTRCISLSQAHKSIEWPVLVAIGASFGIGKAMEMSGAASLIASAVMAPLRAAHIASPWVALAAVYLVTLLFTEFVTNNAAVALAFPIAYATCTAAHANFLPFVIVVMIAASAGFAVPAGYATHLMVHGPGGYRMSDWLRVGILTDLVVMIASVAIAPLIYPL